MSEQFDASRPIYAQLVERLKAKILAGTYPPGGHLDSVRDLGSRGPSPHRADQWPFCNGGHGIDRTTAGRGRPEHGR